MKIVFKARDAFTKHGVMRHELAFIALAGCKMVTDGFLTMMSFHHEENY